MPEPSRRQQIVLASSSPYRAELLARLGLAFEKLSPDIDETPGSGESGAALARRLASTKAAAVAARYPGAIVIGSDQVAECRGRLMGKPGEREAAIEQLLYCSDAEILFHTAVAIRRDGDEHSDLVATSVLMRKLERAQIERYIDIDRPLDCAGAMKSEALGICLVEHIRSDDPTALVGLPLIAVVRLLTRFGLELP